MDQRTELSVQGYLQDWLQHVRTRVRRRTYEGYEGVLRRYVFNRLATVELAELKPLDLQHLYTDLLANSDPPLCAGTVLNTHLVLTQAFGQAVRWGLIPSNPANGAQPPRPRRAELVSVDEVLIDKLLATVERSSCEVPAALAIGTGMRRARSSGCDGPTSMVTSRSRGSAARCSPHAKASCSSDRRPSTPSDPSCLARSSVRISSANVMPSSPT